MDIKVKINPRHNANYYLDVNFEGLNIENAKEVFEKLAKDLEKSLQIMLSSRETERIAILKAAGFVCKRKCYEDEEIAYVYGENVQEFRAFAKVLIAEMFGKYESITFEADECDEFAMELKSMFANQEEESFDTYILVKKEL